MKGVNLRIKKITFLIKGYKCWLKLVEKWGYLTTIQYPHDIPSAGLTAVVLLAGKAVWC